MISELCLLNELVSYLECVSISSGGSLILEFPTLQVLCSSFPISISFLHLIFSITFHFTFYFLHYFLVCVFFPFSHLLHSLLHFMLFSFRPCIIHTILLSFSLCPSKVNLHTYLTTWLISCPVGIFLEFSPYIAKSKIINKSNQIKCAILKINSHHF